MELNALKAWFMSFQMIQDFRLARELSCMTIAGTDLVVRNIRRFPGLKNFLVIQTSKSLKDHINMNYFGQSILMLTHKRRTLVSLYIVCILT